MRRWRPPMPPLQPRTRIRMASRYFVSNVVTPSHSGAGGRRPHHHDALGIHPVQFVGRRHALQIEQRELRLVPILRPVVLERLLPKSQFLASFAAELTLETKRLVDRHGPVLALHPDQIEFAEHDVRHRLARLLADEDADAVLLGDAFQPRTEVHRVAHHRVGPAQLRAHVADAHRPGVDSDADPDFRPAPRPEERIQPHAVPPASPARPARALRACCAIGDRRAPERHDRVADVLVERAVTLADDQAHRREVLVDVLRAVPSAPASPRSLVNPRMSENSTVSVSLRPSMRVLPRVLRHPVHQFRRHVLAEQFGELALRPRLDEIAVRHVQREHGRDHKQAACQRQDETGISPRQEIDRRIGGERTHRHQRRLERRQRGHQQREQHAADEQQEHLGAEHVRRPLLERTVEHAGDQVGMHLDARIDARPPAWRAGPPARAPRCR